MDPFDPKKRLQATTGMAYTPGFSLDMLFIRAPPYTVCYAQPCDHFDWNIKLLNKIHRCRSSAWSRLLGMESTSAGVLYFDHTLWRPMIMVTQAQCVSLEPHPVNMNGLVGRTCSIFSHNWKMVDLIRSINDRLSFCTVAIDDSFTLSSRENISVEVYYSSVDVISPLGVLPSPKYAVGKKM